jgi:hypothetical protein
MIEKISQNRLMLLAIVLVVSASVLSRVVPHVDNFTPMGALALFMGAVMMQRNFRGTSLLALVLPIVVLVVSDGLLALNNPSIPFYHTDLSFFAQRLFDFGAFALIAYLGARWIAPALTAQPLRTTHYWGRVLSGGLGASTLFFLVSNFGVWVVSGMYSWTFAGLTSCYTLAIPFYRNTLAGDMLYSCLLFGVYAWALTAITRKQKTYA